MRFETIRDVLHHAKEVHTMIASHFHELAGKTGNPRVKMLLDYLEAHEEHLGKTLGNYEANASAEILNAGFAFSSCERKLDHLKSLFTDKNISADEVIDQALTLDECIMDMYRKIATEAEEEKVREMFKNILQMEENEQRKVVKNAMRLDML
jgi:rubrerythrin